MNDEDRFPLPLCAVLIAGVTIIAWAVSVLATIGVYRLIAFFH